LHDEDKGLTLRKFTKIYKSYTKEHSAQAEKSSTYNKKNLKKNTMYIVYKLK